ncbi:S1 family peptidase [Stanieria cyanosphaera]|uniref:S1 family peptidase n=1 Tax=Stanieria cyanosphaera TaxID=102116 RepID=UPI001494FA1F|nr:serine protease [Stanieria cyanosphaera]
MLILITLLVSDNKAFSSTNLSQKQLEDFTRSITVRIFSKDESGLNSGSGILIRRQKGHYLVLTNNHVVANKNNSYQIQTPDGREYPGKIITTTKFENDISYLTFPSLNKKYQVINLNKTFNAKIGQNVIAGGFPIEDDLTQSNQFHVTRGQIALTSDRPFVGGYQIGYTNLVKNGMSGGPLLNRQGELIGINGIGKYPLFGNPYIFKDGSTVSDQEWTKMSKLSWAIPIKYILPLPNFSAM